MSITLSVAPVSEPVTLSEAKAHLRVDHSDSDTEITAMIQAARELVEKQLNTDLAPRTWIYTLESFSDPVVLPKYPVSSVTSVEYVDTDGNTQTLADTVYTLDDHGIYLKYGQSWPSVRDQRAAITVTFISGYSSIPQALKHAILMLIADMYENREGNSFAKLTPSETIKWLLHSHRRMVIG